ncbi:glycosyltransferase family 8 protein [Butyrivibrio sp. MC2021]|uniref:glycosyltransferase family 8 protein n=1 Tax=Butyrivibrio sp. MC2021 TaxID=1408306 RepID=UPI0006886CA6|nr:glycosyltransferase family 8 protein [Butyrivibrio sp. MC2021]
MYIAYASDDKFVDVMCVSIMSFNDYNSDAIIFILDCGITQQNKQKIVELCSGRNMVLFIDAQNILKGLHYNLNLDRGSIAAYARLFIGRMLPDYVNKVLYLDCDTLIKNSLKELFETDIAPFTIGGIKDAFSVLNKRVFGIAKGDTFINSGVLLIDVFKWKNEKIEEQIYHLISNQNKIFQGDQGIINAIFHGKVYELPLKYNVMTYLYDFTYEEMMFYRKPDSYFCKNVVEDATSDPVIVHFSTSFKSDRPWNGGALNHPFYDEWLRRYMFFGGKKEKENNKATGTNNLAKLFVIRVLHAYIRPLMQKRIRIQM